VTLPKPIRDLLGHEIDHLDQPFPCAGQAAVSDGRVLVLIGLDHAMGPGPDGVEAGWARAIDRARLGSAEWADLLARSEERLEQARANLEERLAVWTEAQKHAREAHEEAVRQKRDVYAALKGIRSIEASRARTSARDAVARRWSAMSELTRPELALPWVEIGGGVCVDARYVQMVDRALRAVDTPPGCVRWAHPLEPVVVYSTDEDPVALIMPVRL